MDDIETGDCNNDTNINDLNNNNLKKKIKDTTIDQKKIIKNVGIYQERNHIAGLIRKHSRTFSFSNRYLSIQKIGLQRKQKMKLSLLNRYLCILRKDLKEKVNLKTTAS